MTPETVIEIGQETLYITVLLAAPLLGSALAIGLFVGILQAATQIQEMTLSFIPKLLILVVMLFWLGSWMLQTISEFSVQLFKNIPGYLG